MELLVKRSIFTEKTTLGDLYVLRGNGFNRVCYTLEDERRGAGIKIPGETCIPDGKYLIGLSESARFGRVMPMIYNCDNGFELKGTGKDEGVRYSGVRIHGGNTHEHVKGCLAVARNKISDSSIQGTAESEVTNLIKGAIDAGQQVWIEFRDLP